MPKSSSLALAVRGDQDVGRLEVAVHHQAAVGAVDRRADALEEPQPLLQAEARAAPAVLVDRHALHPLQHEERPAVGGAAAVEQAGDAGVIQPGEDLALAHEPAHDRPRVHPALDQLERRPLQEGPLVALGEIDLAHAAAAEQPEQAPGADAGAGRQGRLGRALLGARAAPPRAGRGSPWSRRPLPAAAPGGRRAPDPRPPARRGGGRGAGDGSSESSSKSSSQRELREGLAISDRAAARPAERRGLFASRA